MVKKTQHRFPIFDFKQCRDLEIRVRDHSRSLNVVPFNRLRMISYKRSIETLSLRQLSNWDIRLQKCRDLENWVRGPSRSFKMSPCENDTIRSGTHNFLLTFHSNHRPISHRFWDIRRFPSKIANFPHPRVYIAPAEGFPLELGIGAGDVKLEWWCYQTVEKV